MSGTGNAVPSTGTSLDGDPNYTNNVFGTGSTSIGGQNMGTVNATSTTQMSFGSGLLHVTGAQVTSSEHVQCNPWPANASDIEDTFIQSARDLANW